MVGLVAGDFGKLHSGHLDHIRKAYDMCDYLYIVTHSDESIRARKQYEPDCLCDRVAFLNIFLKGLGDKGEVVLAIDDDGTCVKTLRKYKPDLLIKGGDRIKSNMPKEELDVCEELNIKIIYGVGRQLNSSSEVARNAMGKDQRE